MTPCLGEPISWLRLERYRLHELADGEVVAVEITNSVPVQKTPTGITRGVPSSAL